MTTIHFANARLIDPEAGTDALGSLTVKNGLIHKCGVIAQ